MIRYNFRKMLLFLLSILFYKMSETGSNLLSQYLTGCYSSHVVQRQDMNFLYSATDSSNPFKLQVCLTACQVAGWAYAGVTKADNCYCGDEFGHTDLEMDCNFTCSDGNSCGGLSSFSIYYTIDTSLDSSRKNVLLATGLISYTEARRKCIKLNGDLIGANIRDQMNQMLALVANSSSMLNTTTSLWIGLRKRISVYEWIDETTPTVSTVYAKNTLQFSNLWTLNDPGYNCVALNVKTKLLFSAPCNQPSPFVCRSILDHLDINLDTVAIPTLAADSSSNSNPNQQLVLYIVVPLFIFCYGGACIVYCIHKIIKHCCRRPKEIDDKFNPDQTNNLLPIAQVNGFTSVQVSPPLPIPLQHPPSYFSHRPYSGGKKSRVSPVPDFTESKGINQGAIPLTIFTASEFQNSSGQKTTPMDRNEEKKARLLEKAAGEARERRQKEVEHGVETKPFNGAKRSQSRVSQKSSDPVDVRPESSRSVKKPVETEKDATNNGGLEHIPIGEILRKKMAQQANSKKERKIISA